MSKSPLLLIVCLSFCSCQKKVEKNPDVEKYEEQKLELDILQAELTELRIETAAAKSKGPKTPVQDLRAELEEKEAELKKINDEFAALKASEEETQKALEELKSKAKPQ